MDTSDNIRVFISYTHDSREHKERVLKLAKRLENNGIDCYLDQYVISPSEGWPRWMRSQIRQANFVLVVCTKTYQERYEGIADPGAGAGAKWEGLIITQELYEAEGRNSKFIPIAFSEEDAKYIPIELRSGTWHVLDDDEAYLEMYAHITNQPRAQKGPLGERLILPALEVVTNVDTSDKPILETSNLSPPPEEADTPLSHESQILKVLGSIKGALEESEAQDSPLRTDKLDSFEIVRHHLFSTALMSLQVPSSMLGVHETQLLYLSREQLQLLRVELPLLFRMLINDGDGLIPGWYWFLWLKEKGLQEVLLNSGLTDRNINVRVRTWELLTMARIPPIENDVTWASYTKAAVADESAQVRKAALSYLGAVGGKGDIPTIKSRLGDELSVSNEATIARLLVLARTTPEQVLTETIPTLISEKKRVLSELKANASKIPIDPLLKAVREHQDEDIRFFAFAELDRKGEFTKELAASLLETASGKVAEECYRLLIKHGERFSADDIYYKVGDETFNREHSRDFFLSQPNYADSKAVILEMYSDYSEEELRELIDWESATGDVAYKALALYHFPAVGSLIRRDLDEDFKSYEEPFIEKAIPKWVERNKYTEPLFMPRRGLLALLGDKKEEKTPEASAKGEAEGIKSKYIAAALAGIARNGEAHDVRFGRKYLSRDNYNVLEAAVGVIEKFGDEDDIQALIDIAKSKEGVLQELSACAALKLSPDVKETAHALLLAAKDDLAGVVVGRFINEQDETAAAAFMEQFLIDKKSVVRRNATAFFVKKLKETELEELLKRYTSQTTYYYDVVCWLDRVLYAPAQLKEVFVGQLEGELITAEPNA